MEVTPKAGWTLTEHSRACGYSKSLFWRLSPDRRPHSVKIGAAKLIITESPTAYLERLARESAAAA